MQDETYNRTQKADTSASSTDAGTGNDPPAYQSFSIPLINPYEQDYAGIPIMPPPPPKRRRSVRLWICLLMNAFFLVVGCISSLIIFNTVGAYQRKPTLQHTTYIYVTPTLTPTTTPTQHKTASQIATLITGSSNVQANQDTSGVAGNTGMVSFNTPDQNGYSSITMSTYENAGEAKQAYEHYMYTSDGPALGYYYSYCMLLYGPVISSYVLTDIIQQVNKYCI